MCYFVKKITHFYKKGRFLTKIFQVYEGKIAVFAISDEQIHAHAQFIKPIDVEFFAITREIRDHQELAAARAVANGLHVRKRSKEMLAVFFAQHFGFRAHDLRDHPARWSGGAFSQRCGRNSLSRMQCGAKQGEPAG